MNFLEFTNKNENMPLLVGEEPIEEEDIYKSSSKLLARFPELKRRSQEFSAQPSRSFQEEKVLYVQQCEYGTVHPSDSSVTVIGSDSATTCQLVVLRHAGSGACSLAHLDGCGMEKGLADMVKSLLVYQDSDTQNRIELSVIGGFLDNANLSENIFQGILSGVARLSANIHLVCASVCGLNDVIINGNHIPKTYGAGVVVSSGDIVPVQQFHCHIPDKILRHVAMYSGEEQVRHVYSSVAQEITVSPFQVHFPANEARKRGKLPDELILQSFSTSPHCEPANFAQEMRAVFLFLAENSNILEKFFPERKPRRHKRNGDGDWYFVEESHD